MPKILRNTVKLVLLRLVIVSTLSGCAGSLRLYDENKAKISASVKENYAQADVVGVIDVERKNLNAIHADELKVVRDNLLLQLDFALLELADNDSPMAVTWEDEIEKPIEALGFTTSASLRRYLIGSDEVILRDRQLDRLNRLIARDLGKTAQQCEKGKILDEQLEIPTGLAQEKVGRAQERYEIYKTACEKLKKAHDLLESPQVGTLKKAESDWKDAKTMLATKQRKMFEAQKAVAKLATEYKAALEKLKAAGAQGEVLRKAIKERADAFSSGLDDAAKVAPQVLSEERLSAIVSLLNAAASEQTKVEDNVELAKAVLMVNRLTSLSSDVAELVAEAKAPNISNLLIELQHQTVLLEYEKTIETLQQQRVDIREIRYGAFRKEAELLLAFRDALCSFAFHSASKGHPGEQCDGFDLTEDGNSCAVLDDKRNVPINIDNCALSKPWKVFLKQPPQGDAGREFFKALANYSRLFPVRAAQIEQNFNLIDLQHKENLASREMALRAWNNLVAVPIDQLSAYHQSGFKPEAIADSIVKALGFTAVTVGVSR